MASSIPDFLANMTLSTAPQISFEQADSLMVQASELREEAVELQARIHALNERAHILQTTATGLQAIATQDRAIIESRFELAVELHTDFILIYGSTTNKTIRFHQLESRVEDGLATMEELENFIDDLQSSSVTRRSERSKAPEPETPDSASNIILSVEGAQTSNTPSRAEPLRKRKAASIAEGVGSAKRLKQTPTPCTVDAEGAPNDMSLDTELPDASNDGAKVSSCEGQGTESSQCTVPTALTIPAAQGGSLTALPLLSQESTEQTRRQASIELGSHYKPVDDPCKATKNFSLGGYHTDSSGGTTGMDSGEGGKGTPHKGSLEREKHKSKSKQRRKLLAIAKLQVGAENAPQL